MAKATTVILLLAATAAIAAAHPGLGKGGFGNVQINAAAQETASKTITISKEKEQDLSKCQCKDDCQVQTRKVCKESPKEEEKCKDEEVEEDVVVCANKCFKADKVITIGHGGKGRRLLSANSMNTVPHIAKAALIGGAIAHHGDAQVNATAEAPAQQEICREICKPQKKTSTKKTCKKEKKVELVDCKDEVVSSYCVKRCNCGEKEITITKTPDVHAMLGHGIGKGK